MIVSGGGTGGHIFPAVSIANAIRERCPEADILFVGAEGRMEMQRVPDAGYPIIGLPVAGFDRKRLWRNIGVIVKLLKSQRRARQIVRKFKPQIAIGVGGYASGPTLRVAARMGVPTLIQEQNSYAGVTNKLLAKRAQRICVAYEGMERFFPADKIVLTGNPVRQNLLTDTCTRAEAARSFGLDPRRRTLLVLGGSLGARTINNTLLGALDSIGRHPEIQVIWQTGRYYFPQVREAIAAHTGQPFAQPLSGAWSHLYATDFIADMAKAYRAADLVVSRAGAGSISEFCLLGKPVILVPSPNVAEDHQTKNALALVKKDAALYVKDAEAETKLFDLALNTLNDDDRLQSLGRNILALALPDAAKNIADEAFRVMKVEE